MDVSVTCHVEDADIVCDGNNESSTAVNNNVTFMKVNKWTVNLNSQILTHNKELSSLLSYLLTKQTRLKKRYCSSSTENRLFVKQNNTK